MSIIGFCSNRLTYDVFTCLYLDIYVYLNLFDSASRCVFDDDGEDDSTEKMKMMHVNWTSDEIIYARINYSFNQYVVVNKKNVPKRINC